MKILRIENICIITNSWGKGLGGSDFRVADQQGCRSFRQSFRPQKFRTWQSVCCQNIRGSKPARSMVSYIFACVIVTPLAWTGVFPYQLNTIRHKHVKSLRIIGDRVTWESIQKNSSSIFLSSSDFKKILSRVAVTAAESSKRGILVSSADATLALAMTKLQCTLFSSSLYFE